MRKIFTLILILVLIFAVASCAPDDDGPINTPEPNRMLTVEEILSTYSQEKLSCAEYKLAKYTQFVWDSQVIYNETAMFFRNEEGEVPDKTLLYDIAKVLEVRDSSLKTLYVEGEDYEVVDGKLRWLEGSEIYVMDYDDYYIDEPNNPNAVFSSESIPGKYYYYSEGNYFYSKQVCVTYITTKEWEGPSIESEVDKLPKTVAKLKNKENLTIVYYGDSIMTGCNASGFNNVDPFMPRLSSLITRKLKSQYGYQGDVDITEVNTAVGGWTSANGVVSSEINTRVLSHNPDLVVIGFGANDGTFNVTPQTYGTNIYQMIQKVKNQNPDAEFIIISTPIPNRDARGTIGNMAGNCEEYIETLASIAEEEGIAFADMTTLSKYVLERKDWWDITANNINHPSDFMIRLEAQLVLSKLI